MVPYWTVVYNCWCRQGVHALQICSNINIMIMGVRGWGMHGPEVLVCYNFSGIFFWNDIGAAGHDSYTSILGHWLLTWQGKVSMWSRLFGFPSRTQVVTWELWSQNKQIRRTIFLSFVYMSWYFVGFDNTHKDGPLINVCGCNRMEHIREFTVWQWYYSNNESTWTYS